MNLVSLHAIAMANHSQLGKLQDQIASLRSFLLQIILHVFGCKIGSTNEEVNSFSAYTWLIHIWCHWWPIQWKPGTIWIQTKPKWHCKLRVVRNCAWKLLSSVPSLNPFCILKCKDAGVSLMTPVLHFKKRCFSSLPKLFTLF